MKGVFKFVYTVLSIFILYLVLFTLPVKADAATFTAIASGNYNVGTTWNQTSCASSCTEGLDYPGASDSVIINGDYAVTLTAPQSAQNLTISVGTLDLNGKNLTTTGSTFTNSGTIKLTGDETITNVNPILNVGSIVEYTATSSSRNIKNWDYTSSVLKFSGNGGTFVVNADKTVAGFELGPGAIGKITSGQTLTVNGNFTSTATIESHATLSAVTPNSFAYMSVSGTAIVNYVDGTDIDSSGGTLINNGTEGTSLRTVNWGAEGNTTPPNINSFASSSTTDTTATITWATNELATSTLNYGLTTDYGGATSPAVAKTPQSFTVTDFATSTGDYTFMTDATNNVVITQTVGSEALIELPTSALWSDMPNFRPGDEETVVINPPVFSWSYNPNDPNHWDLTTFKNFQLQVDEQSDFSNPVIDITTKSNMYNFLAPLPASAFTSKTYYWRVKYFNAITNELEAISQTRSFTIPANTPTWDRSMLAKTENNQTNRSPSIIESRLTQHPHMLFNADNIVAFRQHLLNPSTTAYTYWSNSIKPQADAAVISSWWQNETVSNSQVLESLAQVAFAYQMTQDPKYSDNGRLATLLVKAADYFIESGDFYLTDMSDGPAIQIRNLGLAYDWTYELMTPTQRKRVAYDIGIYTKYNFKKFIQVSACGSFVCAGDDPKNGIYDEYPEGVSPNVSRGSIVGKYESHNWGGDIYIMMAALAAYADDTGDPTIDGYTQDWLDIELNAMIARPTLDSPGEGFNSGQYSGEGFIPMLLGKYMKVYATLPEAQFNKNPWFKDLVEWYGRVKPVGSEWETFRWGRNSNTEATIYWIYWGEFLAKFINNSNAFEQFTNSKNAFNLNNPAPRSQSYVDAFTPTAFSYYFQQPISQTDLEPDSKVFPLGGWAVGSSGPTNVLNTFQNGAGFIFVDRPFGYGSTHGACVDLTFDLWAYGQMLTDQGAIDENYNLNPMTHTSLMVDGYGPTSMQNRQYIPYYGRIYAFSTSSVDAPIKYVYTAGEGKNLWYYPGWGPDVGNHIVKTNRHILMLRDKYFVIFDDFETDEAGGSKFSWLYPVFENNIVPNPIASSTFSYTKTKSTNINIVTVLGNDGVVVSNSAGGETIGSHSYGEQGTAVEGPVTVNGIRWWRIQYDSGVGSDSSGGWSPERGGSGNMILSTASSDLFIFHPEYRGQSVKVTVSHIATSTGLDVQDLTGNNRVLNPILGTNYPGTIYGNDRLQHKLWVTNSVPQNTFHFMTVIYPKNPADSALPDPVIERLDDYTARVTGPDGGMDVISFNPATAAANNATFVVDPTIEPLPVPDGAYATVPLVTHTITASAGSGGSVSPSGSVTVNDGVNKTFTITPNAGYNINQVLVDGSPASLTSGMYYTFNTVNANHTISASFVLDTTTPPIISSVASSTTDTTATITWATNELATSTLNYGLTTGYGSATSSAVAKTSHSFTLTGLATSTAYHFQLTSWDSLGNATTSTDYTFNTASVSAVIQPPSTGGGGGGGGGGGDGGTPNKSKTKLSISCSIPDTTVGIDSTMKIDTTVSNVSSAYTLKFSGSMTKLPSFNKTLEDQVINFSKKGTYLLKVEVQDSAGNKAKTSCKGVKVDKKYEQISPSSTPTPSNSTNKSIISIPAGLRLGMESQGVKDLQKYLNSNGYIINNKPGLPGSIGNESTYFGNLTTDAIIKFQKAKGLKPTGLFDESTRALINGSAKTSTPSTPAKIITPAKTPTAAPSNITNNPNYSLVFTRDLRADMSGDDVLALQIYLNNNGYPIAQTGPGSKGKETTYFGKLLQAALIKFQKDKGVVPAMGYFGEMTRGLVR